MIQNWRVGLHCRISGCSHSSLDQLGFGLKLNEYKCDLRSQPLESPGQIVFVFTAELALRVLPAWVRVRTPRPTDAVELLVHGKVLESQLPEAVGHGDAGRARPDDDGIHLSGVLRHLEIVQA